jgi:hypothetical protein
LCGIAKPISDFHAARKPRGLSACRGGFGVASRCKECRADARRPGIGAERVERAELAAKGEKRCSSCKAAKSLAAFNASKITWDGKCHKCADCAAGFLRVWRENNPDAFSRWHAENRDHRSRYNLEWREQNKEHLKRSIAAWAKANAVRVAAKNARRMAAKFNATPRWADENAIRSIYAEAARLTRETGIRHEVDHIYPLQGKFVCGLHCEANLQILTKTENIRKLNRMPDEKTPKIAVDG